MDEPDADSAREEKMGNNRSIDQKDLSPGSLKLSEATDDGHGDEVESSEEVMDMRLEISNGSLDDEEMALSGEEVEKPEENLTGSETNAESEDQIVSVNGENPVEKMEIDGLDQQIVANLGSQTVPEEPSINAGKENAIQPVESSTAKHVSSQNVSDDLKQMEDDEKIEFPTLSVSTENINELDELIPVSDALKPTEDESEVDDLEFAEELNELKDDELEVKGDDLYFSDLDEDILLEETPKKRTVNDDEVRKIIENMSKPANEGKPQENEAIDGDSEVNFCLQVSPEAMTQDDEESLVNEDVENGEIEEENHNDENVLTSENEQISSEKDSIKLKTNKIPFVGSLGGGEGTLSTTTTPLENITDENHLKHSENSQQSVDNHKDLEDNDPTSKAIDVLQELIKDIDKDVFKQTDITHEDGVSNIDIKQKKSVQMDPALVVETPSKSLSKTSEVPSSITLTKEKSSEEAVLDLEPALNLQIDEESLIPVEDVEMRDVESEVNTGKELNELSKQCVKNSVEKSLKETPTEVNNITVKRVDKNADLLETVVKVKSGEKLLSEADSEKDCTSKSNSGTTDKEPALKVDNENDKEVDEDKRSVLGDSKQSHEKFYQDKNEENLNSNIVPEQSGKKSDPTIQENKEKMSRSFIDQENKEKDSGPKNNEEENKNISDSKLDQGNKEKVQDSKHDKDNGESSLNSKIVHEKRDEISDLTDHVNNQETMVSETDKAKNKKIPDSKINKENNDKISASNIQKPSDSVIDSKEINTLSDLKEKPSHSKTVSEKEIDYIVKPSQSDNLKEKSDNDDSKEKKTGPEKLKSLKSIENDFVDLDGDSVDSVKDSMNQSPLPDHEDVILLDSSDPTLQDESLKSLDFDKTADITDPIRLSQDKQTSILDSSVLHKKIDSINVSENEGSSQKALNESKNSKRHKPSKESDKTLEKDPLHESLTSVWDSLEQDKDPLEESLFDKTDNEKKNAEQDPFEAPEKVVEDASEDKEPVSDSMKGNKSKLVSKTSSTTSFDDISSTVPGSIASSSSNSRKASPNRSEMDNGISLDDFFDEPMEQDETNQSARDDMDIDTAENSRSADVEPSSKVSSSTSRLTNGALSDSEPPRKKSRESTSCINSECPQTSRNLLIAPLFIQNFFNLKRKVKCSICSDCFDECVESYEKMLQPLQDKKISFDHVTTQMALEIINSSSDEEEEEEGKKKKKSGTVEVKKTFDAETSNFLKENLRNIFINTVDKVKFLDTARYFERSCKRKQIQVRSELNIMMEELKGVIRSNDNYFLKLRADSKCVTEISLRELKMASLEKRLKVGNMCYGQSNMKYFFICQIVGLEDKDSEPVYQVKFSNNSRSRYESEVVQLKGNQLAVACEPVLMLEVGTRVVAKKKHFCSEFFLGIVAERYANRYLIFFEDGMVSYVSSNYIRECIQPYATLEAACEALKAHAKEFIRLYFTSTRTPIYKFETNDKLEVSIKGEWLKAVVKSTDNSLVTVQILGKGPRQETYFCGSPRIKPVGRPSVVHYNTAAPRFYKPSETETETGPRQVAKKSSHMRPRQAIGKQPPVTARTAVKNMNSSTIFIDEDDSKKGQIVYFESKKKYQKQYSPHECGPECNPHISEDLSSYNPMAQPIMAGWRRCFFLGKSNKTIYYRGPCGRTLRNMYEVHQYLRLTNSPFNVDAFEFEPQVYCLAQYEVEKSLLVVDIKDLSDGREPMPISCVNYYDDSRPPDCIYSTERTPTEGVYLNLEPEFLACCDCEDDCLDKSRCQCWQLTVQGARVRNPYIYPDDVGYVYKRLPNPVPTAIYECNSQCKCKSNCLNRVVQHKIQLKLQVYKTANRGWGIRCLNDIPKGGFVCVYAGHLLTEQKANDGGFGGGDEYFAELDYIEVAERLKEGYEPDVVEDRSESSSESDFEEEINDEIKNDSDEDFVSTTKMNFEKNIKTRLRSKSSRQSQSLSAIWKDRNKDPSRRPEPEPVRKMFGENEEIYVMDAKITGNIGRYFNHSCSPNLFVQNVFVDTHDLRFPWVSFFALHNIRAGTELSWNYNYDVGSVAGKILICQCGSENCRGRIL